MCFAKLKRPSLTWWRRTRSSSPSATPKPPTLTSTLPPRPSSSQNLPTTSSLQVQLPQRPVSSQGLPLQNIPTPQTQHQPKSALSQNQTPPTIPTPNPTVKKVSLVSPPPEIQATPPAPILQPSAPSSALQPPIASQRPVAQSATKTLWEQALAKLEPEDLAGIDLDQDNKQILNELLEATKQKKKDVESEQWRYKTRGGESKLVRDSVSACLETLGKIVAVGDPVISQLPVIVPAAWGSFKLLLTTITAGVENLRVILESLESLTRILSHCTIYETLYIESSSLKAASLLQESLLGLYVSVLQHLCYIGRYLGRNATVRSAQDIGEAIWKGLDERLKSVSDGEAEVMKAADLTAKEDQSERLKGLAKSLAEVVELRKPILETERMVAQIFAAMEGDERLEILNWLSNVSFTEHHLFHKSNRHPETGNWLLNKPHFGDWKVSDLSSLLWLHGIAGSGKTMLASKIIDEVKPKRAEHSLAYFYCNYQEPGRRDPGSVLRAIIKQLCQQSPEGEFPTPVSSIYKTRKESSDLARPLNVDEIKNLLVQLSAGFLRTTIVIDALDECDGDTRKSLFDALDHVISRSKTPVKVFVTSRDDGDIRRRLEKSPNVYIQEGDSSGDIDCYIYSEVEACIKDGRLLEGNVDSNLKSHIIKALQKGARGMFLWVRYQIMMICKEATRRGVEKALTELPKDLNDTYSKILERMEERSRSHRTQEKAKNVLMWILYATRPLSTAELIEAISVTPTELDTDGLTQVSILDICQNLVVFDEKLEVLRFAHFSVQEFLLGHFNQIEGHTNAAEACLTLLTYHHTTSSSQALAFMDYSTFNWAVHVRSSGSGSEKVNGLWKGFLNPSPAYQAWVSSVSLQEAELHYVESEPLAPLIVACYYNLPDIFKFLLDTGANPNSQNLNKRTSLSLAAESGYEKIVQILLEKEGVDVDSKDEVYGRTPLSWAAEKGHEKVVQMLLEKEGVDANSKDQRYHWTPLSWAAERGHEKVVQMLLKKEGVDVNIKDINSQTPLSWAAGNGHEKVVQMLLEKEGVDVNSKDRWYHRTPLSWAAEKGHEKVVQMLLEKEGVDVDSKNTTLSWAAENGHEKVVQMLLEKEGVDVNSKNKEDRTPLSWAAGNGHEKVVQMLLKKEGVDVNSKDRWYDRTPLSWAAEKGHEKVVQMLLEKEGVDVNNKDKLHGQTPLSWAAERGHEKVVQMLLEKEGVDVNIKDINSQTPLSWAAGNGHEKVVQMLLEKEGVDVNSKDRWYHRTPLSWAAEKGHEKVVQMLLEKEGVDVDSKNTTLSWAAEKGHEKIVQMLLEKEGVDVNSKDEEYGRTPLSWAAENGHRSVLELLKSRGAKEEPYIDESDVEDAAKTDSEE